MDEILKLADRAIDLWAVGREIVDHEYHVAKKTTVNKVSAMISSTLSLMIIILTGFIMLIIGFIGIGVWSATTYGMPLLTYATPVGLCMILMIISWTQRHKLFKSITKEIIEEAL